LPFIGGALRFEREATIPSAAASSTTGSFPAAAPSIPTLAAVNLDKLRQLQYRQRAKKSLSILTRPRKLPLLAYRRAGV
jgi:hypothetical protein